MVINHTEMALAPCCSFWAFKDASLQDGASCSRIMHNKPMCEGCASEDE